MSEAGKQKFDAPTEDYESFLDEIATLRSRANLIRLDGICGKKLVFEDLCEGLSRVKSSAPGDDGIPADV